MSVFYGPVQFPRGVEFINTQDEMRREGALFFMNKSGQRTEVLDRTGLLSWGAELTRR